MFEALRSLRDAVAPTATAVAATNLTANGQLENGNQANSHASDAVDDEELVQNLASRVLSTSLQIQTQMDHIPGMDRTRSEQMRILERLLLEDARVKEEVNRALEQAIQQRAQCRSFILDTTSHALNLS
jgi:hypothetical protein